MRKVRVRLSAKGWLRFITTIRDTRYPPDGCELWVGPFSSFDDAVRFKP